MTKPSKWEFTDVVTSFSNQFAVKPKSNKFEANFLGTTKAVSIFGTSYVGVGR